MNDQEAGTIVQERWESLSKSTHEEHFTPRGHLAPLIDVLRRHPRIGQLFPYTSLATLCLSRTTRYPYSGDCPRVDAIGPEHFRVFGARCVMVVEEYEQHRWREPKYEVLGEGDIAIAVTLIDSALPPGCGPTLAGDLDDLRRSEGKSVTSLATRALHLAVAKGDKGVIESLLENGTDVNSTDYDGITALMKAVLLGRVAMVQYLLEQGADVHAQSMEDETALSLALFNDKHPEIVKFLKDAQAIK